MKQTQKTSARTIAGKLVAFSALGAYFTVLFVGGLINGDKMTVIAPNFIIYFNPWVYAGAWLVVTALLMVYGMVSRRMVYGFAWLSALGYAIRTAVSGGSTYLTVAMCGVVALMTVLCGWARRTDPPVGRRKDKKSALSAVAGKVTVAVLAAVAGGGALFLLLASYLTYTTSPSVSTGVYIQLMESLRSGFSFDTTLEFGEAVSHLGAHISPVFLLYLPFYAVLPSPVTLMVLQVAAVYSAVIPLWLIARRRGLSVGVSATLCGLLCLFPAVFGGVVGSLHEYALLLPLLLWLIWALEARKKVLVWVFAALVLCVRETAAIHLFTLGLYWLIVNRRSEEDGSSRKGERRVALILAGVSLVYFIVAMAVLSELGQGTLITRFENVTGEYGTYFDSLIREILYNPALILYEMLTEQKLLFVAALLLPLCLLPVFSRKKAGLVFLFPLLLLNLLADFPFHYSLDLPYAFGVTAFLFYLAVQALERLQAREDGGALARRLTVLAVCFTLVFSGFRLAGYEMYASYPIDGRGEVNAMDRLLEVIEDDASVTASARLCPNLAAREAVYTLSHGVDTDYIVIDLREEWVMAAEEKYTVEYFEKKGYGVVAKEEGVGVVLRGK